ncbi:hypothetical protein TNCV_653511 [Trichonephila clavipes]|nr:hypothetical protein TNCV_653511 [Trichonephila clavipes]
MQSDWNHVLFRYKSRFSLECDLKSALVDVDLHIIRNVNLIVQRYANEILRHHVIPWAVAIGDSFILIQDYASHPPRLVENFLEAETVQRVEELSCSPTPECFGYSRTTRCYKIKPSCYCLRYGNHTSRRAEQ